MVGYNKLAIEVSQLGPHPLPEANSTSTDLWIHGKINWYASIYLTHNWLFVKWSSQYIWMQLNNSAAVNLQWLFNFKLFLKTWFTIGIFFLLGIPMLVMYHKPLWFKGIYAPIVSQDRLLPVINEYTPGPQSIFGNISLWFDCHYFHWMYQHNNRVILLY